jgi:hypothetical protein
MQKKEGVESANSFKDKPADDLKPLNVSGAKNGDTTEYRGTLPSSGPDRTSVESLTELEPKEKTLRQRLKRWGPWRRWNWYREVRRQERVAPDYWHDRDSKENARGQLPDAEGVQIPAVWVAELYTPSTVGGLLKGIKDLGWEFGRTRDDSLTKWMNDVREGRLAGWTSLGLVSPPDDAHFMRERTAPLPSGVRAALPILMSLTPSLTAFIVAFLFDDDAAVSLEAPLRAEFVTNKRRDPLFRPWHVARYVLMNGPIRLGHSINHPDMIRREMVKSSFQELENSSIQWVQDNFPGAFNSLHNSRPPTAALLITERVRPLSEEACEIRAFDGLAINRNFDAWESNEWPGARLVLPRGWDDEGARLVFACRRQDAVPDKPYYHEPTSNWSIAHRTDALVQGLLSRWALTRLLDCYHEALSALRDQAARDGKYRPLRDLIELRSLARTTLYDIGACSQEIIDFAESELEYSYNVLEMTYVREVRGRKPELLNDLRRSQDRRARQVQREAALLQSTLSITNDLSHTITNIRIQRLVVLLTIVSIGIALWSAFLAFRVGS